MIITTIYISFFKTNIFFTLYIKNKSVLKTFSKGQFGLKVKKNFNENIIFAMLNKVTLYLLSNGLLNINIVFKGNSFLKLKIINNILNFEYNNLKFNVIGIKNYNKITFNG